MVPSPVGLIQDFPTYNADAGIITQADGGTGDSAQRTATYVTLAMLCGELDLDVYHKMISGLSVGTLHRYRRSPIAYNLMDPWETNPTNFSRDQHSILMLAMASVGDSAELKASMIEIFLRGGFHQNFQNGTDDPAKYWKFPDPLAPTEISVWIRGANIWPLYPLLPLIDLGFFGDLYFRKKALWDYDNMLAQNIMYAVRNKPTWVSLIAFHLYLQTDFISRLKAYHDPENNGVPGMFNLFQNALKITLNGLSCSWLWKLIHLS